MKKGIWGFLFALLFALPAYAEVVDVGNANCPVGGEKVSGTDFVEHEGKRYGICCAMCADKFKKDPAKYITAMAEEAKTE